MNVHYKNIFNTPFKKKNLYPGEAISLTPAGVRFDGECRLCEAFLAPAPPAGGLADNGDGSFFRGDTGVKKSKKFIGK